MYFLILLYTVISLKTMSLIYFQFSNIMFLFQILFVSESSNNTSHYLFYILCRASKHNSMCLVLFSYIIFWEVNPLRFSVVLRMEFCILYVVLLSCKSSDRSHSPSGILQDMFMCFSMFFNISRWISQTITTKLIWQIPAEDYFFNAFQDGGLFAIYNFVSDIMYRNYDVISYISNCLYFKKI